MTISAVLLTVGEPFAERAEFSVSRQTFSAREVIVVRNKRPFARALNDGASRVSSEFFAQVDADMILDETCFADLLDCFEPGIGVVVGQLRDPLLGRVVGVKIFRRECFDIAVMPDTISPDTDFLRAIHKYGWKVVYGIKPSSNHTFGEHRPDYNLEYVFEKFFILGQRFRYRKGGWAACFGKLCDSSHPSALVARLALAHGLVAPYVGVDALRGRSRRVKALVSGADEMPEAAVLSQENSRDEFFAWIRRGAEMWQQSDRVGFLRSYHGLMNNGATYLSAAFVGLSHGVCAESFSEEHLESAWRSFVDLRHSQG